MVSFSVASVTATCSAVANRALSAATEIDCLGDLDQGRFSGLNSGLHELGHHISSIQNLLSGCDAISPALQVELPRALRVCEDVLAVLGKQLQRLQSFDPQWMVDPDVVSTFTSYVNFQAELFREYGSIIQSDAETQSSRISSPDILQLVSNLQQETNRVVQRPDLLKYRSDTSARTTSVPTKSGAPTRAGPASPPPPAPQRASIASSAVTPPTTAADSASGTPQGPSKGKGFFSGLSQSLHAMTAVMRPRPEPFVVPLCQAALRGDEAQVRGLLTEGANINGRNEEGKTALICAAASLHIRTVQFLIKNGAGIAVKDRGGRSPLYHATTTGNLQLVSLLLQYGADPNDRSTSGKPFFVETALEAELEMVKLLLDKGADPNSRDITGQNIFILAIQAQNIPLVRLLAQCGADVNSRDITGRSALVIAILAGRIDLVKFLLDRGADANCRDITGQPMLIHAVEKNDMDLVKLLFDHGSDPNVRNLVGQPVIETIIKRDNMQLAKLFLERGVDPNQHVVHSSGQTLLLYAIENEKWDLAALFVKHGANTNVADRGGRTPLLEAMQRNNTRLIQVLLQHGADANQEGKVTPFGFARGSNRQDVMRLLHSHGAQGSFAEPTHSAVTPERSERAENADGDDPPSYESVSRTSSD